MIKNRRLNNEKWWFKQKKIGDSSMFGMFTDNIVDLTEAGLVLKKKCSRKMLFHQQNGFEPRNT